MDYRTGKTMRINRRSFNSNLIYFAPDEERVKKFRKKFKLGDRIRARILKFIDERRAIILVGDIKLIAYLKKEVGVGEHISLEVKQLYPHIILKQSKDNKGLSLYI
jgi:hypothetical protein